MRFRKGGDYDTAFWKIVANQFESGRSEAGKTVVQVAEDLKSLTVIALFRKETQAFFNFTRNLSIKKHIDKENSVYIY